MAFDEKSNNDYKILGMGAYGVVFQPAFPNTGHDKKNELPSSKQVSKIFYERSEYNNMVRKTNTLSAFFPSKNLLRPYRRTIKAKNLPQRIRNKTDYENNNANIPMMRMPYFGKSLEELFHMDKTYHYLDEIRRCPIHRVLEQITTLLLRIKDMSVAGYVHGDLHLGNVTFRTEDCSMYLIDFDLFSTFSDFYRHKKATFAEPFDPPEGLFLPMISRLPYDIQVPIVYPPVVNDTFRANLYEEFHLPKKGNQVRSPNPEVVSYSERVYDEYQRNFPYVYSYMGHMKKTKLTAMIQKAIQSNADYLRSYMKNQSPEDVISKQVLPVYDGFRLGRSLAEFLLRLYSPLPGEGSEEDFLRVMEDTAQPLPIDENDQVYVAEKTVHALQDAIQLLVRMSSFIIKERPTAEDAYDTMNEIYTTYVADLRSVGMRMGGGVRIKKRTTRKNRS
jgi:serine/threonine protein kinase